MPRRDAKAVATAAVDLERARPAVVSKLRHRGLLPFAARRLVADRDAEGLVPVPDDDGPDVDPVADRTLDREAAAVDLRRDVEDLDPGRRFR